MVEARLRRGDAHRLEHVRDADGGDVGGQDGLAPGGGDEGLRREIVDLVGLRLLHDAHEAREVAHIAVVQAHAIGDADPAQAVIVDAAVRGSAHDAMNLVALIQQKLREIGAVLSRDARDERALRHFLSSLSPIARAFV